MKTPMIERTLLNFCDRMSGKRGYGLGEPIRNAALSYLDRARTLLAGF